MLYDYLNLLTDHRQEGKIQYELAPIVACHILAKICGGKGYAGTATFIEKEIEQIKECFEVGWEKAPGYAAIRKILLGIDREEFEEVFRMWVRDTFSKEIVQAMQCCIDGKWLCGSGTIEKAAMEMVNAYLPESKLIIAHAFISDGDKTNEIPIVQKLIPNLGITGKTISMDAMHCQQKTLQVIKNTGNTGLIQVKDNQKRLHKAMQRAANWYRHVQSHTTHERGHGRDESRECLVYDHLHPFEKRLPQMWNPMIEFAQVKRTTQRSHEIYGESSFYLSTQKQTASWYQEKIRNHWGIEDTNHHVRDVSLYEDSLKVRVKPDLMAITTSFAFNILTHGKTVHHTAMSHAQTIFANALEVQALFAYVCT